MSDPAVEAAQKAWQEQFPLGPSWDDRPGATEFFTAAAREALKPIRERHVSQREFDYIKYEWVTRCRECRREWPCDTAKAAYTTEELER